MKTNTVILILLILIYSCNSEKYPKYFTYNEIRRDVELPLSFPDTVPIGKNTNCYLVIQNDKGEGKIVFDSLGTHNIIGRYYNTNNIQFKTIRQQYILLLQDTSYFVDKFVRSSILEYRGRKIQCYENQYDLDLDSLVNNFDDNKRIMESEFIDNSKITHNEKNSNDTIKSNDTKMYKILDPEFIEDEKKWDSINRIRRDSIIKLKRNRAKSN